MKKNLVSLLLVGALMAPGAIQVAQATGTGTGASHALISKVENDDGTITKTFVTNYGTTIIQVYEFNEETEDWIVIFQKETENETPPTSWDDERLDIDRLVTTKVIPFETIEEPTAELAEGTREVKVTGIEGVISNIIETGYWNGGEIAYNLPGGPIREYSERTSEPINEVVLVGTGIMGEEKDTTRIEIPFETKVVENNELPVGTEEVSQEGVNGWYELTTIYETKDGVRTEEIVKAEHETDRKEPVNKIIQKGTKEVADEFVVTATLVDEEGNALAGEVLTITGEDVEQELTTDENGAVTFSVPNGTYTVSFGINSAVVTIEDEDVSVKLVAGAVDKDPEPEFYIGIVRNDFPQFDAEDNEYEVVIGEEVTTITITDKDGKLVAVIEYNEDTQATKIKSIPSTPIQPGVNTKDIVDGVKEKFPTFDNEDYTYETEVTKTKVIVTIKNKEGHLVAVVEYDREKEAYSVKPAELTPAKPIEKDEETTDEEESAVEESEVVDVVTADGQPVRVVRTDSHSELPETGELGGATAMMAAALSALGGLGLLFKKRK